MYSGDGSPEEVVGYSENGLFPRPESSLSNFIVDNLAEDVAELTGKKVDVAIMNFGGIRIHIIPSGDILLDNIQSMLPFKNYGTWLSLGGRELRAVFEQMAATRPQCISGARVVVEDGRLKSVMIDGKPLDENKIYCVETIDFLVYGGDGYKLAR